MNLDQKFGIIKISKRIIIYTSKHFFLFKPYPSISQSHFIIASIREVENRFDYLTNEEIMDYSEVLNYSITNLEAYYKCEASNIIANEASNSHFHINLVVRNDNFGDEIYNKLNCFSISKEVDGEDLEKVSNEVNDIQGFIIKSSYERFRSFENNDI